MRNPLDFITTNLSWYEFENVMMELTLNDNPSEATSNDWHCYWEWGMTPREAYRLINKGIE